jgi:hypothetical protein
MKIRFFISTLLVLLITAACEQTENTQEAADIPVVQAFLVPGQEPMISITRIIPYAAEEGDTIAVPISDLVVFLEIRGVDYTLAEDSAGSGNYRLPGGKTLISPGDTVEFHADYKGTVLQASTIVPTTPANLTMSTDVLYYSTGDPTSWLSGGEIDLTWDNPDNDFYYITVQNIETDPTPLNDMALDMPKFGSSSPSAGNQFRIGMRNITYFGTHQLIIYHVNHEFAELFDNPGMSSVALTEQPTNISNGLGIFTAMNPDTLYFEVKRQ